MLGFLAACLAVAAADVHAQPVEPAPAAPATPAAPAPEPAPPVVVAPPPSAAEVTAPAPQLEPIQPSFPTPAPATVEPPPPPAAEAAADPLAGAVKFKPGKGLDIKSADGNWSLNIKLKGQFLDEFQLPTFETAINRNYFIVRRQRLALQGSIFTKDIKYKTEFTFAGQELTRRTAAVGGATAATMGGTVGTSVDVVQQVPLLDLYLDFAQLRDLTLRVGQAKPNFGRERVLSDSDLQTVDRSLEDAEFNFDRDIGVELRSSDLGGTGMLRYTLGVYAAEERNASTTSIGTGDFGHMFYGRFEVLPMGTFEDTPVDFARTTPKLSFGVAYALVQADARSAYAVLSGVPQQAAGAAIVDFNSHNFTADFLFKAAGFSALGAFHYRKIADLPNNVFGRDGLGVALQLHYLFSKDVPLSVAVNGSTVRGVGDDTTILERSEIGGGLGYYFYEHGLKLEAEYEHIWRDREQPERVTIMGAPTAPDNRIRLQLSFII